MPPTKTYQEAVKEAKAEDTLIKRRLVPVLLERYNTTPTYIMDPRTFGRQFEAIMYGTSSPEEFILGMETLRHQNLSIMLREIRDRLEDEDGYDHSCLSSLQALLALADRNGNWQGLDNDDDCESSTSDDDLGLLAIDEFWYDTMLAVPPWMGSVYGLLPENTSHLGLPEEYTSGEEDEEDSQYDYSESSGDEEEPVTPNKSQKRGASQSTTTSSLSTSASTEGRALRNGKRTHTPEDDADTIVEEAPKNKRRRKGETTSSSNSSRSASPPKPQATRTSGRLNRAAGRKSA
ncbi:hypothetical protein CEP54_012496 [Fusarium duplospermum]|uniref:Uncharacterized protein n=1 Tax=Fusarium duplospermum TaxID=1325734 RepID=A0A428P8E3_9HYPO|nr:hypothetical protein CEP54_012496 [Fusarium duplospermum]